MNHQPLVSCIIIFDSASKFLDEAIQSIIDQSYTHWELLLVGNSETISSNRDYLIKYPEKIFYLSSINNNTSDSRNLAVKKARGKYIAFLNPDDTWLTAKLQRQVEIMENSPDAQMVYGRDILWFDWINKEFSHFNFCRELEIQSSQLISPPTLAAILVRNKYQTASISNSLMRKILFDNVFFEKNGLSEKYEDQSFFVKVLMHYPVYASAECMTRIRSYPKENNIITEESEDYSIRRKFLDWISEYLKQQKYNNFNIQNIVDNEIDNLSSEKIEKILRSTLPDFPVNKISFLGEGVHNRTYRINNEYIYRSPLSSAQRSFLQESYLLELLKGRVTLQIPAFIYIKTQSKNKSLLIENLIFKFNKIAKRFRLSGLNLFDKNNNGNIFALYKEIKGDLLYPEFIQNASTEIQDKAAEDIAMFLRSLHSFPVSKARSLNITKKKFHKKYFLKVLGLFDKYLRKFFDKGEEKILRELFSDSEFISNYTPSLLHGDLHWDHFIFNKNNMRIVGVIDFGSVFIGDPAYDFTGIWRPYGDLFTLKVLRFYGTESPDLLFGRIKILYCCDILESAAQQIKINNHKEAEKLIVRLKTSSIYN